VGTFVVEDLGKFVKARLLLKKIGGGGFGSFFFQSKVHAFMTAVLLGMAGLDAFNANAQT
jgi:hypothetical protein